MGVVDPKSGHLEDSTPIHIHEKGAWTLSVKGGGLADPKVVDMGTDDKLIPAWTGILKDGSCLGNGKYTLVLSDQQQEPDGDGEPPKEVPIIITSLAMTVGATGDTLHAFSPGTASTKKTLPISIQANPAMTWDLTASGPGGKALIKTGTDAAAPIPYQFQWDGKDINGVILNDGAYTLTLMAKGASTTDQNGNAIIDTKPPAISNIDIAPDPNDPTGNKLLVMANILDIGLSMVEQGSIKSTITSGGTQSDIATSSYNSTTGNFASADFLLPDTSTATAFKIFSITPQTSDVIMIAVNDRAANRTVVTQPITRLSVTFNPASVTPLADRQTNLEGQAARSTMTIKARRNGAPVPGLTIHLQASFVTHSGGHSHDEATRPRGAFYKTTSLGSETNITTDGTGQVQLTYRSSGMGGDDFVVASARGASFGQGRLPVTFNLSSLPPPSLNDHYILIGRTTDHPSNHNCTASTQALMTSMATAYFQLFRGSLSINDESLPFGGPFDLGPNYGVPFWTLTRRHINHRQGNSTDIPLGNRMWNNRIARLGGSVYVESDHWHITTL